MLPDHRTALVTGAAGGIGAATARRLAGDGYRLFLLDRDERGLRGVCDGLADATPVVADLADPASIDVVVARLSAEVEHLDALVNAAGIAPWTAHEEPTAMLARVLEVNLIAAIGLSTALRPLLRRAASGRIVNVGSVQADRAATASVAYVASKGGLHAATRALAVDLAPDGVLVNAVAPGFIDTPMATLPDGRTEYETDWFRSVYIDHGGLPLRRPGTADEVAAAIALLLAPENTYVTGAVLAVDGGLGAAL